MPSDKDRDHLRAAQARARVSAVRARILDLYEAEPSRSMAAAQLVDELSREGWDVSLPQINYHLSNLSDAQLIPAPNH